MCHGLGTRRAPHRRLQAFRVRVGSGCSSSGFGARSGLICRCLVSHVRVQGFDSISKKPVGDRPRLAPSLALLTMLWHGAGRHSPRASGIAGGRILVWGQHLSAACPSESLL